MVALPAVRAIRRSTSKDFLNWTEPVDMEANAPGEQIFPGELAKALEIIAGE